MHQDAHAIHSEFIGVLCLDHAVSLAPVHQQRLVRKNTARTQVMQFCCHCLPHMPQHGSESATGPIFAEACLD